MSSGEDLDISRLPALREHLRTHPGQRVVDAMRTLDLPVRYVLAPNGQQLDQHLALFETPQATVLWWMGNDQELMGFLHEVARLTHNLVASVKTVVDHTRHTLNAAWPDKTNPIHREFEQAVKVFGEDPRLVIVQKLRNYVLHREVPGISGRLNLVPQEGAPMSSVRLTTANLLEWDGWESTARSYLEQAGGTIELRMRVFLDNNHIATVPLVLGH